jgi:hypothetical protein
VRSTNRHPEARRRTSQRSDRVPSHLVQEVKPPGVPRWVMFSRPSSSAIQEGLTWSRFGSRRLPIPCAHAMYPRACRLAAQARNGIDARGVAGRWTEYDRSLRPGGITQPARNHARSVEPEYSPRARESYRRPPLEMRQQRSAGGPYLRHGEHHADECITEVAARKVIPEIKLVRAENTQITNLRDRQQTAR